MSSVRNKIAYSVATVVIILIASMFSIKHGLETIVGAADSSWKPVHDVITSQSDMINELVSEWEPKTENDKNLILRFKRARDRFIQSETVDEQVLSSHQLQLSISEVLNRSKKIRSPRSSILYKRSRKFVVALDQRLITAEKLFNSNVSYLNEELKKKKNVKIAKRFNIRQKPHFIWHRRS